MTEKPVWLQYSNEKRVEADGYKDLGTIAKEYKAKGLDLAKFRGTTKYDTILEGMTWQQTPVRKYRYDQLDIEQRNMEYNHKLNLIKAEINKKLKEEAKKKYESRIETEVEKRLQTRKLKNEENKTATE